MGLTITYFIIAIYSISLLLIFFYSLAQLNLLVNYLGYKRRNKEAPKYNLLDPKEIPFVGQYFQNRISHEQVGNPGFGRFYGRFRT